MYWPIGAPTVYEQDLAGGDFHHAIDDSSSKEANSQDLISGPSTTQSEESLEPLPAIEDINGHGTPMLGGEKHGILSHKHLEQPQKDSGIIAMQPSRSGQIFATITLDALTIWEARVSI